MPYEHQYVRKNATSALTSAASATNANAVGNDAVMTISRMINVTVVSTSMKPKVAALNDAVTDLLKTILKPEDQALLQQAMSNTTTVAKRTTLPWLPRSTIVDSIYIAIISGAKKQWTAHKGLL